MEDPLNIIERRESGGRNIHQQLVPASVSSASGHFQMIDPTWRRWASAVGIDTTKYPHAIDAPYELQRQAAAHGYRTEGFAPWEATKNLVGQEKNYPAPNPAGTLSATGTAPSPATTSATTPPTTSPTTPYVPPETQVTYVAPPEATPGEAFQTAFEKAAKPPSTPAPPPAPAPAPVAPVPSLPAQTAAADMMASLLAARRARAAPGQYPPGLLGGWT